MPKGEVGIFYLFGFNFIDSYHKGFLSSFLHKDSLIPLEELVPIFKSDGVL